VQLRRLVAEESISPGRRREVTSGDLPRTTAPAAAATPVAAAPAAPEEPAPTSVSASEGGDE